MPEGRVSKRSVDALVCPPGKDRVFIWDDSLSGFGAVAFPSGRKAYVAQYRQAGRSRRITIGEHGRLTPDEARREARKVLGAVESGVDPIKDRQAAREAATVATLIDAFLVDHVKAKLKSGTADWYETTLAKLRSACGTTKGEALTRAQMAALHRSMADTPVQANRLLSATSSLFAWAERHSHLPEGCANPARRITRYKEQGRERFLTSEELFRLGDALKLAETIGLPWETDGESKHLPTEENRRVVLDPFATGAIRLLLLTGARLREILHARWQEIDFERGILFLPDSKTGKKPIYLSAAAQAVLVGLPRIEGNPFVIPGGKEGRPRHDLKKPWLALTRAARLEGLRLHDLRHSFASVGAGASLGLQVVGRLLGHAQPTTTARYSHLDADPMRRAVETIGSVIDAAMSGRKSSPTPLRRPE
jgi:integrase